MGTKQVKLNGSLCEAAVKGVNQLARFVALQTHTVTQTHVKSQG